LNADLATALQLPVMLVTSDKLGCLNEVLLSVEAIKLRGLHLIGVAVSTKDDDIDNRMSNVADLREILTCPVISIPHNGDESHFPDDFIDRLKAKTRNYGSPRLVG